MTTKKSKVFVATCKKTFTEKVYVEASSQRAAQKALTDNVTMKRIKTMSVDITYGDMKETDKMPSLKSKAKKK